MPTHDKIHKELATKTIISKFSWEKGLTSCKIDFNTIQSDVMFENGKINETVFHKISLDLHECINDMLTEMRSDIMKKAEEDDV